MGNWNSPPVCSICFEPNKLHITCALNHVICRQCLSSYVKACCEDVGKLKDNNYKIPCPDTLCTAKAWDVKSLKYKISYTAHELFISTVEQQQHKVYSTPDIEVLVVPASLTNSIMDSLNVTCPKCDNVLDQTPDGCCAIRCNRCATYFCWLCFEDSPNSATCHAHVAACELNSNRREPFVPKANVDAAHKAYRLKKVRAVLQTYCLQDGKGEDASSHWTKNKFVCRALQDTHVMLKMNDIVADDVLEY